MILRTGVTQETKKVIDLCDTMTLQIQSKFPAISLTIGQSDSMDTIHEALVDYDMIHAIALTAHAHQVTLALKIDDSIVVINALALIHPYETCHVLDVVFHNIHSRVANVPFIGANQD